MTVFSTFNELAGSYRQLAAVLASPITLREAAAIVEGSVAVASGQYRGKRIVATQTNVAGDTALVRMTSRKAHLLDHDTKAHPISPRRVSALGGPRLSHPIKGTVRHPGTRGKHMWEMGVEAAVPLIGDMRLVEISHYEGSTTRAAFKSVFG